MSTKISSNLPIEPSINLTEADSLRSSQVPDRHEVQVIGMLATATLVVSLIALFTLPQPARRIRVSASVTPTIHAVLSSKITGIFPNSQDEFYEQNVQSTMFDGLTGFDQDNRLVGRLAQSWTNPDARTWVFNLQSNATFHNGAKVTANDVKFSLDQSLKNSWPGGSLLSHIGSVTVLSPTQVQIKTTSDDPILLNELTRAFIINQQQYATLKKGEHAVGAGAYRLVTTTKDPNGDEHYLLEAYTGYYGSRPQIKKLDIQSIADDANRATLLQQKKVDAVLASGLTSSEAATLKTQHFSFKRFSTGIDIIAFDATRAKTPYASTPQNPFKDIRVRRAIAQSLDLSQLMVEYDAPAYTAANQLAPVSVFGSDASLMAPIFDPTAAKKLLAEAGYPKGFSTIMDVPGPYAAYGQAVANQLQKNLGLTIKVNLLNDRDSAFKKLGTKDTSFFYLSLAFETFDFASISQVVGTPDSPSSAEKSNNFGGYSNPVLDKQLAQTNITFNPEERKRLLQQAQKTILTELPIIPLGFSNDVYISNQKVEIHGSRPADWLLK